MRHVMMIPVLGLGLALMTGCGGMSGHGPNRQANAAPVYTQYPTGADAAGSKGGAANGSVPTNQDVRTAQQKLQQLGLYDGPVDGLYGRRTIAAVNKFQSANDLPQTGALTDTTLQHLQTAQAPNPQGQPQTAQAPNNQPNGNQSNNQPDNSEPNNSPPNNQAPNNQQNGNQPNANPPSNQNQ